jgi:transcriptional regulator with XRE-family HTH domain
MQALSDAALAHHADEALPSTPRVIAPVPTRAEQEAAAYELRRAFCEQLKAARERKGISLHSIAGATKISESLFAELERSDVSRWPTGIYRRAFVREYAAIVGLPPDSTVSEFVRLFPDELDRASAQGTPVPGPLRLTMARHSWRQFSLRHAQAATLDAAIVLLASGALAGLTATAWWTSLGVIALCYHVAATAILGCSPGARWFRRAHRKRSKALRLAR